MLGIDERGGDKEKQKVTTHIVISGIFNSCDGEDKNQRHDGGEPGQGRDLGDQLKRAERQAAEAPGQGGLAPTLPLLCFIQLCELQKMQERSLTCRMRRNRK